jgi:beta-glucosidase
VLANDDVMGTPLLPFAPHTPLHLVGFGPEATARSVAEQSAGVVVARISSPFEPRDNFFLESGMQQGSLDLEPAVVSRIHDLAARHPVVLVVTLVRPAILTSVADAISALVVDFGASDEAVLRVLTGEVLTEATLPFELPRSMEAVRRSLPDVASDTDAPLYPIGFGIRLPGTTLTDEENR